MKVKVFFYTFISFSPCKLCLCVCLWGAGLGAGILFSILPVSQLQFNPGLGYL